MGNQSNNVAKQDNIVELKGHLRSSFTELKSGNGVSATFLHAVLRGQDQEQAPEEIWYELYFFGELAEQAVSELNDGNVISISGKFAGISVWDQQLEDGAFEPRAKIRAYVNSFEFLNEGTRANKRQTTQHPVQTDDSRHNSSQQRKQGNASYARRDQQRPAKRYGNQRSYA